MADTLHFRGTQIGDGIVALHPATAPATPPVIGVGVYQDTAAVFSQERNLLARIEVVIHIKRSSIFNFEQAVDAIQRLAGLSGAVEIKTNGSLQRRASNWTMEAAPMPETLDGFGGRFVERWTLAFVGASLWERF